MADSEQGQSLAQLAEQLKRQVEDRSTRGVQEKLDHYEGLLQYLQGVEDSLGDQDVSGKVLKMWVGSSERVLGSELSKEIAGDEETSELLDDLVGKEQEMAQSWQEIQGLAETLGKDADELLADTTIPAAVTISQARDQMGSDIAEIKERVRQYGLDLVDRLQENVGIEKALSDSELEEWNSKFEMLDTPKPKEYAEAVGDMREGFLVRSRGNENEIAYLKRDRKLFSSAEKSIQKAEAQPGSPHVIRFAMVDGQECGLDRAKEKAAEIKERKDSTELRMAIREKVSADYFDKLDRILDLSSPSLDEQTKLQVMEMLTTKNLDARALKSEWNSNAGTINIRRDLNELVDPETLKAVLEEFTKTECIKLMDTSRGANENNFNACVGVLHNLDKGEAYYYSQDNKVPDFAENGDGQAVWFEPNEGHNNRTTKKDGGAWEEHSGFASKQIDLLNQVEAVVKLQYEGLSYDQRRKSSKGRDEQVQLDGTNTHYKSISPFREQSGYTTDPFELKKGMKARTAPDGTVYSSKDAENQVTLAKARQARAEFTQGVSDTLTKIKGERFPITDRDKVGMGNEQILQAKQEALDAKGKAEELGGRNDVLVKANESLQESLSRIQEEERRSRESIRSLTANVAQKAGEVGQKTQEVSSLKSTNDNEVANTRRERQAKDELAQKLGDIKVRLEQAAAKPGLTGGNLKEEVARILQELSK